MYFTLLTNISLHYMKALLLADYLQDLAVFMYMASNDMKLHHLSEKLARKITSIIFK